MILGERRHTAGSAATLDDLFRRAGVRRPDAVALADPPNREEFTDGAPRTLTFAEADRAISALAARLRGLGLQTDTLVAIQLPNTVESLVALLAILRAGMIAVPIPLLWRQQEIVAALGRVGAKAILTVAQVGSLSYADVAMRAAVDLFQIRHVCAFGRNLPDGVAPLDDIFASENDDLTPAFPRLGVAAAHVAAVTFEIDATGLVPIARSHVELVAGGLETFLETDGNPDMSLLSTIPVSSFAGIALTALSWLLSGGTLRLHHSFNSNAFATQVRDLAGGALILPAPTVAPIADAGLLGDNTRSVIALWRNPERLSAAKPLQSPITLVDVACFGEIGLVAARRGMNGLPAPIPLGGVDATRRPSGAPTVIQTRRTSGGTLALRGRMVPTHAFLPGAERSPLSRLTSDPADYVDTGFACQAEHNGQALTATGSPPGLVTIGSYRFRQIDIDELITLTDPDATIVGLPDVDLGLRLAGSTGHRDALCAKLQSRGTNPLITGAFRRRGGVEAA
jgi:hypothetical protein